MADAQLTNAEQDVRAALSALVAQLAADGELDDDDLAVIHDAAIAATNQLLEAKRFAERAHLHDEPHAPVMTLEPVALAAYLAAPDTDPETGEPVPADQRVPEQVDASDVICHDCRRHLVADAGTLGILVCPTLHGRRPAELVPTEPRGAVECGGAPPA